MAPINSTRELWLERAVKKLIPLVLKANADADIPAMRVSVGWPGGKTGLRASGQCWAPEAASDGVAQIFISPVLDDEIRVLSTLLHEMVHAIDRNKSGHTGAFRKLAVAVGLEGRMTATTPNDELVAFLKVVAESLGAYSHAKLTPSMGKGPSRNTSMQKAYCPTTGYTVRVANKWLAMYGAPTCPCCDDQMRVDYK